MKSSLRDAYRILGLSQGASMDEVKKARRKLARKWHPDIHQDKHDRILAENRIKQINAAFAHIKKVKQRSAKYQSKTKDNSPNSGSQKSKSTRKKTSSYRRRYTQNSRQTESKSKTKTKSHSSRKNTYRKSKTQKNARAEKQSQKKTGTNYGSTQKKHSDSNSLWTRLMQKWEAYKRKRAKKRAHEQKKRLNRERAKWQERYDNYKSDHRVGFYKSPLNRLIFGYLERWFSKNPKSSSVKNYSIDEKQVQDLQYSMMENDLFYSVNTGANVFLKYILGFIFCFQFISNIHLNYFRGTFYGSAPEFIGAQFLIGGLLMLLFLPDTLFQRYVLWKYRNVSISRTRKLFFNKHLPDGYEKMKNHLLIAKYAIIGFVIWIGY